MCADMSNGGEYRMGDETQVRLLKSNMDIYNLLEREATVLEANADFISAEEHIQELYDVWM